MNRFILKVAAYLILAAIFYLVFSGIELTFDFTKWHIVSRLIYIIGAVLTLFRATEVD